ncbi:MAG TPA: FtsX-like permease family protein, partial [Ilumatobacteraceae bacterium]|nr:FtsX-like permease family protein [Ilumatobacteraceae bacterium]
RGRVDDTVIDQIRAVPGVAEAEGDVQSFARITTKDGKDLGVDGPPKYGAAFTSETISPWRLNEGGRAPSGPDEVVLDTRTAKDGHVKVGDVVTITAAGGSRDFNVTGIVNFSGRDGTAGPTWAFFDLPTAQEFVVGEPGKVDGVLVRGDGTQTEEQLQSSIQKLFDPDQTEVLTGQQIIKDNQDQLAEQFGTFTTFLTIFAGIALFVGSFVIYNVFKISAAHRMRENALMRAIGARSSQVTKALFVEASAVGLIGGLLGFVGGLGLALGVTALLNSVGFGTGDTSLVIKPQSLITTVIVGLVVTLICATFPALRAGRVPPLAAMRDVSVDRSGASRKRLVIGIIFGVIAILGIAFGLTSDPVWLAPGVVGLFVALIAFGPIVVGPIANLLTRPLQAIRGVTGQVAGRNAARSPERTALTAAALGIGLALLVAVSTFGSSVQDSIRTTLGKSFTGGFAVTSADAQSGSGGLPLDLAAKLNDLPEVSDAAGLGIGPFLRLKDGAPSSNLALVTDPARAANLVKLKFTEGGWNDIDGTNIGVQEEKAKDEGWTVGSTFDTTFTDGSSGTLTVSAIYSDDFFSNFMADAAAFEGKRPAYDFQVVANAAPGVSEEQARTAIASVTDQYPTAKLQTRTEFIDSQVDQLTGILNFVYALLAMSVFIAILGIVLTLLLAVYERRRELGLMRAVGTTRPQVRGSVRWEAIITALLGALMGLSLGLILGWIVVKALGDQGINEFSVSPMTLVVFAVLAVVLAVLAAWVPARRAAKAGILEAIATT